VSELVRWFMERLRGPVCDSGWPLGGVGCMRPATKECSPSLLWFRPLRFCDRHAPPHATPRAGPGEAP
jgi:hypothetical protein